jgi:hypothetical protein
MALRKGRAGVMHGSALLAPAFTSSRAATAVRAARGRSARLATLLAGLERANLRQEEDPTCFARSVRVLPTASRHRHARHALFVRLRKGQKQSWIGEVRRYAKARVGGTGQLGVKEFPAGTYLYMGSARRSLRLCGFERPRVQSILLSGLMSRPGRAVAGQPPFDCSRAATLLLAAAMADGMLKRGP